MVPFQLVVPGEFFFVLIVLTEILFQVCYDKGDGGVNSALSFFLNSMHRPRFCNAEWLVIVGVIHKKK